MRKMVCRLRDGWIPTWTPSDGRRNSNALPGVDESFSGAIWEGNSALLGFQNALTTEKRHLSILSKDVVAHFVYSD
ncbi:hypothetical protein TNCV_76261 [Trichonephila clavipes]|nr:hypothetical protein TNCV_76261 [Trichonephila clavipes]